METFHIFFGKKAQIGFSFIFLYASFQNKHDSFYMVPSETMI